MHIRAIETENINLTCKNIDFIVKSFKRIIVGGDFMLLTHIINKKDVDKSINSFLTNNLDISSRLLNKLINNKKVLINKKICDTRNIPHLNDILTIDFSTVEDNSNVVPSKMDLDIVYEDEWFLIINKPAGIPIHPSRSHFENSLSNGVRFYFDTIGLQKKIRPVNRLDLDTSGLVIFAKCEYIQECFIRQMSSNLFQKEYLCLVNGSLMPKTGTIDLPISRKSGSIIERCVDLKNGQPSITYYKVIKEFPSYSLVKCKLGTGRTHQIRVHMANIGHPLLGDTLYGTRSTFIDRQALHSYKIKCIHPISKKPLTFEASLPSDLL